MPTLVDIDGVMIDMDDPCAVVSALRAVELKLSVSGAVVMTRFSANNEVRWGHADVGKLGDLIAKYERMCDRQAGRRTRYAKRMRFAPERF
jgi:hypothetical protein